MRRDSFVFYRSFAEALIALSPKEQTDFMWAILNYALNGESPDFKGLYLAVWTQIKYQLDKSLQRYENCVENGKKGGAPIGNQNAKKQPKNNLKTTKKQPKNNLNDNDNVNVNVNDNEDVDEEEEEDKPTTTKFFADEHFLTSYFLSTQFVETLSRQLSVSVPDLKRLAQEILTEWEMSGKQWHDSRDDAIQHLTAHLRIAVQKNKKQVDLTEVKRQRDEDFRDHILNKITENSLRRGTAPATNRAEDYTTTL